jgi:hypothetical protein
VRQKTLVRCKGISGTGHYVTYYTNGVPSVGVSEFVQDRIKKYHPGYRGVVRHLRWFTDPHYHDVFFIEQDNQWIVVDGPQWHKDVIF